MACGFLGHWYREVGKDLAQAKNCYEESLLLDPQAEGITDCLKQVNKELGLNDTVSDAAGKAALEEGAPSAFAAQSQKSFDHLPPRGKSALQSCCHKCHGALQI